METSRTAFDALPGDDSLPAAIRRLQVALQAELLRSGSQWEESLSVLQAMAAFRRPFPSAADALAWYRAQHGHRRQG
jgi:hypothetical protein